ncbi:MAG: hypothetical protein A2033_00855 [Bacteroidetes bacterium GWA2_31_9]|nr:MAG: hypothetical protein A2033_00855 [Bacteroidetes bacterium GWA2_31_9]
MEKILFIEETEETPLIKLDSESGLMEISGRSLPENASSFFEPVHKWLSDYLSNPAINTTMHLKLEYFNSSSAKQIMQIILLFEQLHLKSNNVKILWFYSQTDELIESRGRELKNLVNIPFELTQF